MVRARNRASQYATVWIDVLKVTQRLTREDWILAAFRALASGGPSALRVEPVARGLGATKGSFYWHFPDPSSWRDAMLAYWADHAYARMVAAVTHLAPGHQQLSALIDIASAARDPAYGGDAAEPALRAWARYDPVVAEAVERVDTARTEWVAGAFAAAGIEPKQARAFYAAHLGLESLRGDPAANAAILQSLVKALKDASDSP